MDFEDEVDDEDIFGQVDDDDEVGEVASAPKQTEEKVGNLFTDEFKQPHHRYRNLSSKKSTFTYWGEIPDSPSLH